MENSILPPFTTHILDLVPDALRDIAAQLPRPTDFLAFRLVCRQFNESVADDGYFAEKEWIRGISSFYKPLLFGLTSCVRSIVPEKSFERVQHGHVNGQAEIEFVSSGSTRRWITCALVNDQLHGVVFIKGDEYHEDVAQLIYHGSFGLRIIQYKKETHFLPMDPETRISRKVADRLVGTQFQIELLSEMSLEEAMTCIVDLFEQAEHTYVLEDKTNVGDHPFWFAEFQRLITLRRESTKKKIKKG